MDDVHEPDDVRYQYRKNAPPDADIVFCSTDGHGTPGRLNRYVLHHLKLTEKHLPTASELADGYSFLRTDGPILCFVVTIGRPSTAAVLEANLLAALDTLSGEPARSLWVPLMGTGDGRLPLAESFDITVRCLSRTGWLAREGVVVTISGPTDAPPASGPRQQRPAEPSAKKAARPKTAAEQASGSAAPPPEPEATPYPPPMAPAARAVLDMATALIPQTYEQRISSTALFFAMAESQAPYAPAELRQDFSAGLFSDVVRAVVEGGYRKVWNSYFRSGARPSALTPREPLPPTPNTQAILASALARARKRSHDRIEFDDLVVSLLECKDGRSYRRLEALGGAERLLDEYLNARTGDIALKLFNDVASTTDSLGYDRYAEAIHNFLVHEQTPPPISISIQAPWGVGKSSLMGLLRERLDPKSAREPPDDGLTRLRLDDVMRYLHGGEHTARSRLLDRLGLTRPRPAAPPPALPRDRLWTVWFNAWKYESSEQVWAGLVDAIVCQISDRLPRAERELFLLKLHLSRIDDGKVRRRIYDRVFNVWWAETRRWIIAGAAFLATTFGLSKTHGLATDLKLPAPLVDQVVRMSHHTTWVAEAVLAVAVAVSYFASRFKTKKEEAVFSLADYIKVPDYSQAAGSLHEIHNDLKRVFNLLPLDRRGSGPAPIVIFIDDLDRCPPSKVASVVEGISAFLGSDSYKCMFVVGMDPQMVAAALETAHKDLVDHLPSYERTVPMGWRFMDKFIQLPFTIPPCRDEELSSFLSGLADPEPTRRAPEAPPPGEPAARPAGAGEAPRPGGDAGPHRSMAEGGAESAAPDQPGSELGSVGESRDVGRIIRRVSPHAMGNPREIKRIANLARFYLQLRNVRRRDPSWRAPDIDQYARWIALTSHWPDMMRWLLWGADETNWTQDELGRSLVVRRLQAMEEEASTSRKASTWIAKVGARLQVPHKSNSDWVQDSKLYEFFRNEARMPVEDRVSDAAQHGFF